MFGKIQIQCELVVRTGMHIGGSSGFSAIGAVDSPVVRDPHSGLPIVPGSSLKGKLRTLIARSTDTEGDGSMPDFSQDSPIVLRMFGSAKPVQFARLQFADAFMTNANQLKATGVTEIKSENTISRLTSEANPRQIERVVRDARFGVNIVYNAQDEEETREDLELLATGMKLLEMDYLGGHGSRGSGRVHFENFKLISYEVPFEVKTLEDMFQDKVANYDLFSAKAGV